MTTDSQKLEPADPAPGRGAAAGEPERGEAARLAAFEREISGLRLRGGSAAPEVRLLGLGVVLLVAGIVVVVVGWFGASGTSAVSDQIPYLISGGMLGVGIAIVGAALFLRYSLSRYLRYWLLRSIHEQRAQADRSVEVLERIEAHLAGRQGSPGT